MTTKEWLNRAKKIEGKIKQLEIARQKAKELAYNITSYSESERVQTSRKNSSEEKFTRLAEYSRLIDEQITESLTMREEIITAIKNIKNPVYEQLLIAKYINGDGWEKIAEDLNYSDFWVKTRLHSDAIREIEKYINH